MSFFSRIAEGLFFETDRRRYWDYRQFGLTGEEFDAAGPNGTRLHGVFLKALPQDGRTCLGTVLFFHNCTKNYEFHLPQVSWMVTNGWNVIMSDPEGCGKSSGELTLRGLGEDAEAVYRHALTIPAVKKEKLIILGQGAGAEAALRLVKRYPQGAAGLVIESVWATHRGWMLRRYGPGVGHLGSALLPEDCGEEPVDCLKTVKIPLVFLYPAQDRSVPEAEMNDMLHACPGHREIWMAQKESSLTSFGNPTEWRSRFLEFASGAVGTAEKSV